MVRRSDNPWENETRAGLISIGSHQLFISTSGPPRKQNQPVVVFFSGGGAPIAIYLRLQRLLSAHWRVYFHDRSGYDRSEFGPYETLTGQRSAEELQTVLANTSVGPPYILMGHSYGGIAARAFLELQRPDAVQGMVLADTATELMYELFQPEIPPPSLQAISDGVDWAALTHLKQHMKLTDDEYREALEAAARTAPAAQAEDCRATAAILLQSRQFQEHRLSPWPLSVIRCNMPQDFRTLYNAGVGLGQGTPEQREDAMRFIEKFEVFGDQVSAAQLRLSSCNTFTYYSDVGHDDIFRRPEVYVEALRWVMERVACLSEGASHAKLGVR